MVQPLSLSVNISVANLEISLAWYSRVLGFEQFSRSKYPELEIAFTRNGPLQIELIQFGVSTPGTHYPDAPRHASVRGLTHFAFTVPSIEEAIRELKEKQIPLVWGPNHFTEMKIKVVFVRDPDGNLVKLVENVA